MPRKPTDEVQLKLRFKERLRQRLSRAAAQSDHSMNAEIIRRLELSFSQEDVISSLKVHLERMQADILRGLEETKLLGKLSYDEMKSTYETILAQIAKKDES
jgi:hypothetical protein